LWFLAIPTQPLLNHPLGLFPVCPASPTLILAVRCAAEATDGGHLLHRIQRRYDDDDLLLFQLTEVLRYQVRKPASICKASLVEEEMM
jgi:hypothetical protein